MGNRRWGIVKWFKESKGYGRIMLEGQDGNHVFVLFSEIPPDASGRRCLKAGQRVSFDLIENPLISDSQRRTARNIELDPPPQE